MMTRLRPAFVLLFAAALIGCAVGPAVENFAPAQQPAGVEVTLSVDKGAVLKGELLEVRNIGLVVLTGNEVTLIPYTSIRKGTVRQTSVVLKDWTPPTATDREKLRLLSRFPQGINPSLLASLLAVYQQKDLAVWNPSIHAPKQ